MITTADQIKKQESEQKKQERREMMRKWCPPELIEKAIRDYKAFKKDEPRIIKEYGAAKRLGLEGNDDIRRSLEDIARCLRSIPEQYEKALAGIERYTQGLPDERDPSRPADSRLGEIREWLGSIGPLHGHINSLLVHINELGMQLLEARKNRVGIPVATVVRPERPAHSVKVEKE